MCASRDGLWPLSPEGKGARSADALRGSEAYKDRDAEDMEEGLYKVLFQTQLGQGTGVVTVREGRLTGGDSVMYYTGEYTIAQGGIDARLVADTHSVMPGIMSVLGLPKARLHLKGVAEGQSAHLSGTSPDHPGLSFEATLTRLAD